MKLKLCLLRVPMIQSCLCSSFTSWHLLLDSTCQVPTWRMVSRRALIDLAHQKRDAIFRLPAIW